MRDEEKQTIGRARRLRRTMTRAEVILWQHIRRKQLAGFRFRRQMPVGPYIADFACVERNVIVEVDGDTHSKAPEIAHDMRRTAFLQAKGWHVHRVWNTDVYENLEGVLDGILHLLEQTGRG